MGADLAPIRSARIPSCSRSGVCVSTRKLSGSSTSEVPTSGEMRERPDPVHRSSVVLGSVGADTVAGAAHRVWTRTSQTRWFAG